MPFGVNIRWRSGSLMMRARSACDRTRLSNSATSRTGAGVSGSGRGASGRSNSSLPCSSRKTRRPGRSRPTTSRSRVRPDQACASRTDGRAERGQVPGDQPVQRRAGLQRPAEPGLGRGVRGLPGRAPHGPGRHLDQRHQRADALGQRRRRVLRPLRRQRGAQLAEGHGPLLDQDPARGGERGACPPRRAAGPAVRLRPRSTAGWTRGRSSRQSRAETRWMVPRMSAMRTTCRVSISSARSSGPEPGQPGPQAVVRRERRLGLQPHQVLDRLDHALGARPDSRSPAAGIGAGRSSSCRLSRARFSARGLSRSGDGIRGGRYPECCCRKARVWPLNSSTFS